MAHILKILPVMDIKDGHAVLAQGGDRAHYRPVRSILHQGSDPIGLAIAFRERLGLSEIYIADLDAIAGLKFSSPMYQSLNDLGMTLWVDGGIRSAEEVSPWIDSGVQVVIAGLETVRGPSALQEILEAASPDRLAFSLDLRGGKPLVETGRSWGTDDPIRLASKAIDAGITRLILLDLARVGTGTGTGTIPLLRRLRESHPALELVAGGGISGPDDLRVLRDAGASAALVGSALHDGRLGEQSMGR